MASNLPSIRHRMRELLYQALGEPIGLLVRVQDPAKFRAAMISTRADTRDPALGDLTMKRTTLPAERGDSTTLLAIARESVIDDARERLTPAKPQRTRTDGPSREIPLSAEDLGI